MGITSDAICYCNNNSISQSSCDANRDAYSRIYGTSLLNRIIVADGGGGELARGTSGGYIGRLQNSSGENDIQTGNSKAIIYWGEYAEVVKCN